MVKTIRTATTPLSFCQKQPKSEPNLSEAETASPYGRMLSASFCCGFADVSLFDSCCWRFILPAPALNITIKGAYVLRGSGGLAGIFYFFTTMALIPRNALTPIATVPGFVGTAFGFAAVSYAQFLCGRFFYGNATQRALAFIDNGQPVPESFAGLNIFFLLILPNMLAFCLYLAVFELCCVVPRDRRSRLWVALSVSALATGLTFLSYMAAGITRYGS